MANLITGLFDTEAAAEAAVSQLLGKGYAKYELTIIQHSEGSSGQDGGSGKAKGSATGAVALAAMGGLSIPGLGVIAAGPLAAALASAAASGQSGGIVGRLVAAGIPRHLASLYAGGLPTGGVIVAVEAHPGEEELVRQVLQGGGGNAETEANPQYVIIADDVMDAEHGSAALYQCAMAATPLDTIVFDDLEVSDRSISGDLPGDPGKKQRP